MCHFTYILFTGYCKTKIRRHVNDTFGLWFQKMIEVVIKWEQEQVPKTLRATTWPPMIISCYLLESFLLQTMTPSGNRSLLLHWNHQTRGNRNNFIIYTVSAFLRLYIFGVNYIIISWTWNCCTLLISYNDVWCLILYQQGSGWTDY